MNSISPNLNIMIKACEKASKVIIRDFGEVDTKIADIDSNAMKLIATRVKKIVEDSIKEMNPNNLKYNVSKDEKPIVAEVVTNKTFIKKIEDKVLDYFKKIKKILLL